MSVTDELLRNAEHFAARFTKDALPPPPAKKVAIVAFMDPRVLLGLDDGDAHIIHSDGGAISGGELRSLSLSQRVLGTEEIVLIHRVRADVLRSIERVRASTLIPRLESVRGFVYEAETGRLREII